jgi:lipopolysaccharide export system permease protein
MYILTRYVVWEVLKLFLAALISLTMVVTLAMGVKEGLSHGLPPAVILRTLPCMVPEMFGITIPVAMLFSVSSVFGRMTGTNEIVAIKSLGISPMAVVWPILVLACFLSLGTVWMYEIAATWSKPNYYRIAYDSLEEIAYSALRMNHSYSGDQFSATVVRVDGRTLIRPWIMINAQPGQPRIALNAETAELSTDKEAKLLNITCTNFEFDFGGPSGSSEHTMTRSIPLPSNTLESFRFHRDWVAMRVIAARISELEGMITRLEKMRDAKIALKKDPKPEDDEIANKSFWIRRLRAEPYRRWANGFTCLCFTMIGIPVSMILRHTDVLTNFFACFLPILSFYYPLLMFSEDLAISGKLPPIAFWAGNALLCIAASFLLSRVVKH